MNQYADLEEKVEHIRNICTERLVIVMMDIQRKITKSMLLLIEFIKPHNGSSPFGNKGKNLGGLLLEPCHSPTVKSNYFSWTNSLSFQ